MNNDIIVALSTPPGNGAIGVIRLSGKGCIELVDAFFRGADLVKADANTIHYGKIIAEDSKILDDCLVSIFKNPKSYTKEDIVELSCHGSPFILDQVIQLCLRNGARLANKGEFTLRAFLNGQLDLSQAEAVADLVGAENEAEHALAINQMRGGILQKIAILRQELIDFAALIELELDFGEEDVDFADKDKLESLISKILKVIRDLTATFAYGNAIKKGIPVAIVGQPNVGKSTLLNALLEEDKAIVSNIPGTTRDVIEDTIVIDGIPFRFIDTAGLRETEDEIESIGIAKTKEQIEKATIILFIDDITEDQFEVAARFKSLGLPKEQKAFILLNKVDLMAGQCGRFDVEEAISTLTNRTPTQIFSARDNINIDKIKEFLIQSAQVNKTPDTVVVSNLRHYEALQKSEESLQAALTGLQNGITGDFIAIDIRQALHHMGLITGEIHTDDLLDSIFSKFCIGK